MSKIFLAIFRAPYHSSEQGLKDKTTSICDGILIANQVENDYLINTNAKGVLAIFPKNNSIAVSNLSMVSGSLQKLADDLTFNENAAFNGSFRIITNDDFSIAQTNLTASRSIWYYHDAEKFIVSRSQRAIIMWLNSFVPESQAVSWMLACGNIGPGYSWDKRLKHLAAGQKIKLNRNSWELTSNIRGTKSEKLPISNDALLDSLKELLDKSFKKINLPWSDAALTLSGGYDSRTVLYYLNKNNHKIPAITWGLSSALNEPETDAHIAKEVAEKLRVEHSYYVTDFKEKSFDKIFNRFLMSGEGRLDHINSFMDGFNMWEDLNRKGIHNIIRADETFGWLPCQSEQDVRISIDINLMEDNANMCQLSYFGIEDQIYPESTFRDEFETLEKWRDRLYREFRIPFVLTGLHDLVSPYAEVFNPMLDDDIVNFFTCIPDNMRTNKKLYSNLVKELIPGISIANKASVSEPASILKSSRIVSMMLDELGSQNAKNLFNSDFIKWIQFYLKVDDKFVNETNDGFALWVKSQIPWKLKKIIRRDLIKYKADFNQLAFRATIAVKMQEIFRSDANYLKTSN